MIDHSKYRLERVGQRPAGRSIISLWSDIHFSSPTENVRVGSGNQQVEKFDVFTLAAVKTNPEVQGPPELAQDPGR